MSNGTDPGLTCLVILLRCHGVTAEPEQIRHRIGRKVEVADMLRCAKELGLKARVSTTSWKRLQTTPLPAIVPLRDGGFLVLGKVADDRALVQTASSPRPVIMERAEFEAAWDRLLLLMTRRCPTRTAVSASAGSSAR